MCEPIVSINQNVVPFDKLIIYCQNYDQDTFYMTIGQKLTICTNGIEWFEKWHLRVKTNLTSRTGRKKGGELAQLNSTRSDTEKLSLKVDQPEGNHGQPKLLVFKN